MISISKLNNKIGKCPHLIDVFCTVTERIIECPADRIANCHRCTIHKYEEE